MVRREVALSGLGEGAMTTTGVLKILILACLGVALFEVPSLQVVGGMVGALVVVGAIRMIPDPGDDL